MNGWLVFLVLLAAYLGLVTLVRNRDRPLPGGFELQGPFLLWKTQFGKAWIQKVARPRGFWNAVADVGIVLTWLLGLAVFALLLYQVSLYFTRPDVVVDNAQPPEFLIGLPGINPLIPVGYGIVALILALVIHEGSHGVMAYAARMRVKSLGLLFFIIPVGAFVEPDEEDLERATTREKNRVFAAGPTSNIVLALAAGALLSFAFLGNLTLMGDGSGVAIANVEAGSPADEAGLREGDLMTVFAGRALTTAADYVEAVNGTRAGERVTVEFLRGGETMTTAVVLADKHAYYERVAPEANQDEFRGKGFLGVRAVDASLVDALREAMASPFSSVQAFLFYISYPFIVFFEGIDILAPPYSDVFAIEGPLASLPRPVFFGAATLLYWVVWINLMLGTFNALPAGPLDGGQMFRATLRERLFRRYGVDRSRIEVERAEFGGMTLRGRDEETQAKLERVNVVVRKATWSLGLFILGLILLPIFGPPVLDLFV